MRTFVRADVALALLAALPGCARTAAATRPADHDRLGFLVGCWEGPGGDGVHRALRVTREADALLVSPGAGCAQADPPTTLPLFRIGRDERHGVLARPVGPEGYVWTGQGITDAQLILKPRYAPVWMRFRLLAPGRLEWSSGNAPADQVVVTMTRAGD